MSKIYSIITFLFFSFIFSSVTRASTSLSKTFTTSAPSGIEVELSGAVESVSTSNGNWLLTAGGDSASTHYARLKYKLPELIGLAPTTFYMKSTVVLPPDFYTRQTAGFRIMNVGNSGTTLNGAPIGSSSSTVMFTGLYLNSDHTLRVSTQYGSAAPTYLFNSGYQLPVGQHTLELFGDVANVSPWYFMIDGKTMASGVARLSAESTPVSERVVTRMVTGIDGAAGLANNSMSVQINSFEIASYDPHASPTVVPTLTPSPSPSPTSKPWTSLEGDFSTWLSHYLQSVTGFLNGDYSEDGFVDGIDYMLWVNNYGN